MDKLLSQVKAEFKSLHASNSSPSNALKEKVAKLLSCYPRKFISEAIDIKPTTLSNWKTRHRNEEDNKQNEFIHLPITPTTKQVAADVISASTKLSLELPNKINLLIEDTSLKDSAKIIRYVVEEFSSCSI